MTRRVAFCDLRRRTAAAGPDLHAALHRVVVSQECILGPEVSRFEAEAARYLGAAHAVGVSSGSDALSVALSAVGIAAGDEVVTTPFSFVATAEAVVRIGAVPRFVDVSPGSTCIDVERVRAAVTPKTRAILPVHVYGAPADPAALTDLAATTGVPLVEDAAQAFGTRVGGRALGTWGQAGCYSFFPTKVLGAMGDGGLVVVSSDALCERVRSLRQHGLSAEGRYTRLGGNHRLDAIQAAVLSVFLSRLDGALAKRREIARSYDAAFGSLSEVALPRMEASVEWNAASYTIRVPAPLRGPLRAHLERRGIETRVYYAVPLHLEPAFSSLGHRRGDFPEAERAADEVLSLPLHPGLEEADVASVGDGVRSFFA